MKKACTKINCSGSQIWSRNTVVFQIFASQCEIERLPINKNAVSAQYILRQNERQSKNKYLPVSTHNYIIPEFYMYIQKADQTDEKRILMLLVSRVKLLLYAEISLRANPVASKVKNWVWPMEAGVGGGGLCPWPESVFSHRTQIHALQIEQTFQCTKTSLSAVCFSLLVLLPCMVKVQLSQYCKRPKRSILIVCTMYAWKLLADAGRENVFNSKIPE